MATSTDKNFVGWKHRKGPGCRPFFGVSSIHSHGNLIIQEDTIKIHSEYIEPSLLHTIVVELVYYYGIMRQKNIVDQSY